VKDFFKTRTGRGVCHAAFALLVSLILLAPMFFTGRTFGQDWTNHLWAMYVQGDAISHGGPTLFMHTDGAVGIFYPHFAFYGGSFYVIGGSLSALLGGQPVVAFLILWVAGFLMAYSGMLWLSFHAGLRGWQAHAAPIVVVASAYYVGLAYERGALPELMAISAIPLLLAAALRLLRAERIEFGTAVIFAGAAVILTGSHNLTLIWGSLAIGALTVVGLVTVPSLRRIPRDRALTLCVLGGLAVAVNAWFLFPDVAYSSSTFLGAQAQDGLGPYVQLSEWFNAPSNVFSLFYTSPSQIEALPQYKTYPSLHVQLPVLILLWGLVVAVALKLRRAERSRAIDVAAGLTIVMLGFVALLMFIWPWNHIPRPFNAIQFTFRMESYIVLLLGLIVAALLRAIQVWDTRDVRLARGLRIALVVALVFGFGQAVHQSWRNNEFPLDNRKHLSRSQVVADVHKLPPNWGQFPDYGDISAPLSAGPPVKFNPHEVKDDHLKTTITVPVGQAGVATNISGGPYLVKLKGAREIGRGFPKGFQILAATNQVAGKPAVIEIEPQSSKPVVAGRWISILALVGLIGSLGFIGYRSRRR
jgi:hypothetical protein